VHFCFSYDYGDVFIFTWLDDQVTEDIEIEKLITNEESTDDSGMLLLWRCVYLYMTLSVWLVNQDTEMPLIAVVMSGISVSWLTSQTEVLSIVEVIISLPPLRVLVTHADALIPKQIFLIAIL